MFSISFSFVEYFIEIYLMPYYKLNKFMIMIGLLMIIIGHVFRIGAMFTAKSNFTHLISFRKKQEHVLVQHGLYSLSRHPSYFGFFMWALGTQVMCFNPISIIGFTLALWKFFNSRIQDEEMTLISFFGPDYINYSKRVPILIPCKMNI
jgi:protein-S-isoprenylcysteine O-methyltransferase